MRKITIHREKCVGCLTCTAACMVAHFDVDSRSRIILDAKGKYNPIFCKQCEKIISPLCTARPFSDINFLQSQRSKHDPCPARAA